jgi:uncharacterized surface protein with fasciclin (FAS1) repeats
LGEDSCGAHILRSHILRTGLCSGLLAPGTSLKAANLLDEAVSIAKQEDGRLRIEDSDVIIKDIVATNGVIHVIDSLIIPASAQPLAEAVKERVGGLLQRVVGGSTEAVNSLVEKLSSLRNVSLFLPAEAALRRLPEDLLAEVREDKKRLQELVLHHVLPEDRDYQGFK